MIINSISCPLFANRAVEKSPPVDLELRRNSVHTGIFKLVEELCREMRFPSSLHYCIAWARLRALPESVQERVWSVLE